MAVIFSPVQDATIPPIFDFTMAVSGEHARTLVECLRDPFDANRVMCLELLYKLDTAKMGLNVSHQSKSTHIFIPVFCL